ncbi:MAG: hypothetical protein QXV60_02770 [Nitrososphaerota archaeon]
MYIELVRPFLIVVFLVLFGLAVFMIIDFYVCDSRRCKAFRIAKKEKAPGSKEHTLVLLRELCNDGIWSIPYIGATVLTIFLLWFLEKEITVKTFTVTFLVIFLVIYFLFSFFCHHYVRFFTQDVSKYIQDTCIDQNSNDQNIT